MRCDLYKILHIYYHSYNGDEAQCFRMYTFQLRKDSPKKITWFFSQKDKVCSVGFTTVHKTSPCHHGKSVGEI